MSSIAPVAAPRQIDETQPTATEREAIATLRDDIKRGVHPLASDVALLLTAYDRSREQNREGDSHE